MLAESRAATSCWAACGASRTRAHSSALPDQTRPVPNGCHRGSVQRRRRHPDRRNPKSARRTRPGAGDQRTSAVAIVDPRYPHLFRLEAARGIAFAAAAAIPSRRPGRPQGAHISGEWVGSSRCPARGMCLVRQPAAAARLRRVRAVPACRICTARPATLPGRATSCPAGCAPPAASPPDPQGSLS